MPHPTDDILTAADLQSVAGLNLMARGVVEGLVAGRHRSPHRGNSVEFRQHRPYVPGDDLRTLDSKLYGKTDRFYVREFEEETNLAATLLLDASGSMGYGRATTKLIYAVRLAACLAHVLLRQGDAVGTATFDAQVRRTVPARSNPSHLAPLLETMLAAQPAGEADVARACRDVGRTLRRRGLVFLFSDCFGDVAPLRRGLAALRAAKHEVVVFQVFDRDELDFPFAGRVNFEDLERRDDRREVDARRLRRRYLADLADFRRGVLDACARAGVDLVPAVTDQPLGDVLRAYLARRARPAGGGR